MAAFQWGSAVGSTASSAARLTNLQAPDRHPLPLRAERLARWFATSETEPTRTS